MTNNIHNLTDKYFAGETSAEEEKQLRLYFSQEHLPEDLQEMAPLFTFLEDEALALAALRDIQDETPAPSRPNRLLKIMWAVSGIAASVVLGITLLNVPRHNHTVYAESCVWVNGQRITDPEAIQQYAEKSFDKIKPNEDILEEQLNFMFE